LEKDIKELVPRIYIYLRIERSLDIEHKIEREKLKTEYFRRWRLVLATELSAKVLATELSAKNEIKATGSWAVLVLTKY
jgi:hypothetical protein